MTARAPEVKSDGEGDLRGLKTSGYLEHEDQVKLF
jgi:hypothetical protein